MVSLNEILQYTHPHAIQRYQKDYPDNTLSAELAWREMLKYLWLSAKHREDLKNDPNNPDLQFDCAVHHEMKEMDDMWHTFILFTREYTDFGQQYFGHYLHHAPNVDTQKPDEAAFQQEFERFLSYAYDNLGEDTVRLWFAPLLAETTEA